jgi:hypothetical protein
VARQISPERKTAYYVGLAAMGAGVLVFASTFLVIGSHMNDGPSAAPPDMSSIFVRPLLGMALIAGGRFLRGLGARGLAGSGTVLDPGKAREDLEPYSRMAGGMARDALDEAGVPLGRRAAPVVMIKCRECGKLNEEDSKFCQECGKPL